MNADFIIRTFFELAAVLAIFIGLLHEEKIVRWEAWIFRKIKRSFRKKKRAVQIRRTQQPQTDVWMHQPNRSVRNANEQIYYNLC